ncbi:MAG: pyridoxal-phosphate dependent enzyme, partial [Nitrococcus sp.]|nr:pyridoxal-phosphate dependent enzyme [Nitrococcus sp.]
MKGYLQRILTASVYDIARQTPLQDAANLSARLGNRIMLKREDLQPVFSFKIRGAYNKILRLGREQLEHGVICSSAGNHAQGVALSAKRLGIKATIVMPRTTPGIKVDAVRHLGGRVIL